VTQRNYTFGERPKNQHGGGREIYGKTHIIEKKGKSVANWPLQKGKGDRHWL